MQPQKVLQQIALSFDVAWWQTLIALATKGTVFVAGRAARKDPFALTKLIVSESITMTLAVPSEAVSWLQYGDLSQLRNSSWVWHISAGEDFGFELGQVPSNAGQVRSSVSKRLRSGGNHHTAYLRGPLSDTRPHEHACANRQGDA